MTSVEDLRGFTVGVTADRRGDEQTVMLRRLGVDVVRGPTIRTLPVAEGELLQRRTVELLADPPDFVVANTGIGIRSWLGMAETWGLDERLRAMLGRARIAARGPKAAGAVLMAGLDVWWRAPTERLEEVGRHLVDQGLVGRRVAVQLHGDDRQELTARLEQAGAKVVELPVYRWTLPEDGVPVQKLIDLCCRGGLDAVTFTAGPAVRNLVELADAEGRADELVRALNDGVVVACIGPVCAAAALKEGIVAPVTPEHWRLGSLVRAVGSALAGRRRRFVVGKSSLTIQGSVLLVDGEPVGLTERERRVLDDLAARPGATLTRSALLRGVWGDAATDPHALETVITRLRSKMGPAGGAVQTVVRRGYRFDAQPA